MKKLVSLVLALCLVLASCAVAFAADSYKITVENTNTRISLEGKEYKAYKIFDAVYGTGDAVSYTIKSNSFFYTNDDAKNALDEYFVFTPSANDPTTIVVTVKKVTNAETGVETEKTVDARALADALTDHVPSNDDGHATGSANKAEITVPAAGYYLVTGFVKSVQTGQEVETAVALVPVKDATAKTIPKADVPDLKKQITAVKENGTAIPNDLLDSEGKAAVAKVGSVVDYKLTSTVPDIIGYDDYTYTFTDAMSSGLTYNDDAKVYINEATTPLDDSDVEYTKNSNGFTLTLPFNTLKTLTKGQKVEVKYSATVNASALNYNYEKNTADLEYSTNPGGGDTNHTPDQETFVIDVDIDADKIANGDTTKHLAGAQFKVFKGDTIPDDDAEAWYKWDDTDNVVTWVAKADADTFETNSNGKFEPRVKGLDAEKTGSKYGLLEIEAPQGYNPLKDPIIVTLTATYTESNEVKKVEVTANGATVTNGTVNLKANADGNQPVATAQINNNSGTELPSTGGIGTTIFYILGGLLVVGAAVILIARRKAQD